ncbi:MAG: hypothetical protein OEV94_01585 [Deltaproteobacteria bacterium]|nr:hypothetical protein [Deltaproteobacteria bacterium]
MSSERHVNLSYTYPPHTVRPSGHSGYGSHGGKGWVWVVLAVVVAGAVAAYLLMNKGA